MNGKKIDISCPEAIYEKYVQKVAPVHDSRARSLPGELVKALHNIRDCKKVLDVCGGTGRIARYLVNRGHKVKVVDSSEDMLRIARRKGLEVEMQDARHLKEAPASYDAVICLGNSLGGIPTKAGRNEAISEMVRVSKKLVIIDCNNRLHDLATVWLSQHVRRWTGCYKPGIQLRKDVATGLHLGDIVYHDRELDAILYHYVYSALELREEMRRAGLSVQVVNSIIARRVVLIGSKE